MQHFSMRRIGALIVFVSLALPCSALQIAEPATETLVLFRHAEKPAQGLGQLTCRGLNRALALPEVLSTKFGKPDLLYAPDPAEQVHDPGGVFSYVRPLATIEPTAIKLGMSVNAQIGFTQIDKLEAELIQPSHVQSKIFIAWEHVRAEMLAKKILTDYRGDPSTVPAWSNSDYDMIYVIKLMTVNGNLTASLTVEHEGLNDHLSDLCPVL